MSRELRERLEELDRQSRTLDAPMDLRALESEHAALMSQLSLRREHLLARQATLEAALERAKERTASADTSRSRNEALAKTDGQAVTFLGVLLGCAPPGAAYLLTAQAPLVARLIVLGLLWAAVFGFSLRASYRAGESQG